MVLKVVALLARQHGLAALQSLLSSPRYQVVRVATHRRMPKSEDPQRLERADYSDFVALSTAYRFPLTTVDSLEEQKKLEEILLNTEFDLLVSISWRRLIPLSILQRARLGGVNLHRGRLPEYPGAEPIKQALANGDNSIAITAHILDEQIDHGKALCVYEHPVSYQPRVSLEKNIERLKGELTPHFGPLLLQAMEILTSHH